MTYRETDGDGDEKIAWADLLAIVLMLVLTLPQAQELAEIPIREATPDSERRLSDSVASVEVTLREGGSIDIAGAQFALGDPRWKDAVTEAARSTSDPENVTVRVRVADPRVAASSLLSVLQAKIDGVTQKSIVPSE